MGEGTRGPHRVLPSAAATKSYSVVRERLAPRMDGRKSCVAAWLCYSRLEHRGALHNQPAAPTCRRCRRHRQRLSQPLPSAPPPFILCRQACGSTVRC
jgi:hypothetical protein